MAKGVKTGGRKVGTPNRATADIKAAVRLSAANSLLDRAHGRPAPITLADDETDDKRTESVTIRIVDCSADS